MSFGMVEVKETDMNSNQPVVIMVGKKHGGGAFQRAVGRVLNPQDAAMT
jgi:hypothetical protein